MDDRRWLSLACDLARLCPPSETAFSVGAVIVSAGGRELARGHSRETDPTVHAEESALAKLATHPHKTPPSEATPHPQSGGHPHEARHPSEAGHPHEAGCLSEGGGGGLSGLAGATVYSSLEPCGRRKSRPTPCARLIVEAGIRRVVYAWREPSLFVEGDGDEILRAAGVEVVRLPGLAEAAREPNAHLLG